ncbi:MAG TPA: hypothetical protein VFP54_07550 [Acidimicrobiales bacterium]|nr:hypothetical protein [Acidimicrobiales bacterium]
MAVIEITRFRLAEGSTDEELLNAEAAAQARFYYRQPGLLRRTTARGAGRGWVDLVLWASADHAAAGERAAASSPLVAALTDLIDPGSLTRERFETVD